MWETRESCENIQHGYPHRQIFAKCTKIFIITADHQPTLPLIIALNKTIYIYIYIHTYIHIHMYIHTHEVTIVACMICDRCTHNRSDQIPATKPSAQQQKKEDAKRFWRGEGCAHLLHVDGLARLEIDIQGLLVYG